MLLLNLSRCFVLLAHISVHIALSWICGTQEGSVIFFFCLLFRLFYFCWLNVSCAACPLNFTQPLEVIKACRNLAAPNPSCCSSLNTYIAGIQNQMLITNKQAIICATVLGSKLRQGGVMTNVYELCDIDLKDFSIQGLFPQFDTSLLKFSLHFILYSIWYLLLLFLWIVCWWMPSSIWTTRFASLSLSTIELIYCNYIFRLK